MGLHLLKRTADWLWRCGLRLERLPRIVNVLIGFAFMGVHVFLDELVGEPGLWDDFGLLPVAIVSWLTRSVGIGIAFSALTVALSFALASDEVPIAVALSASVSRFLLYVVVVVLIGLVRRDRDRQQELAVTDALTGLANRRKFRSVAEIEMERSRRYHHPLSLMYIDVDDFKAVNDAFGHEQGDRVLRRLAVTIESCARSIDTVGRIGGDEFAVLLPETGQPASYATAQRLSSSLESLLAPDGTKLTCSIGLVTYRSIPSCVEELLSGADAHMYLAKSTGKDRVQLGMIGSSEPSLSGR